MELIETASDIHRRLGGVISTTRCKDYTVNTITIKCVAVSGDDGGEETKRYAINITKIFGRDVCVIPEEDNERGKGPIAYSDTFYEIPRVIKILVIKGDKKTGTSAGGIERNTVYGDDARVCLNSDELAPDESTLIVVQKRYSLHTEMGYGLIVANPEMIDESTVKPPFDVAGWLLFLIKLTLLVAVLLTAVNYWWSDDGSGSNIADLLQKYNPIGESVKEAYTDDADY